MSWKHQLIAVGLLSYVLLFNCHRLNDYISDFYFYRDRCTQDAIQGAYECLDMVDLSAVDTYSLTLMAYAYSLDDSSVWSHRQRETMEELDRRKRLREYKGVARQKLV